MMEEENEEEMKERKAMMKKALEFDGIDVDNEPQNEDDKEETKLNLSEFDSNFWKKMPDEKKELQDADDYPTDSEDEDVMDKEKRILAGEEVDLEEKIKSDKLLPNIAELDLK